MDASAVLSKVAESIGAGRSFGPPFEHDGVMLIPVAYVIGGGGGGSNRGKPGATGDLDAPAAGGGFGTVSIPIGAWVIKNGEVRWTPAFDAALLLITVSGLLRGLGKSRRRRRELPR